MERMIDFSTVGTVTAIVVICFLVGMIAKRVKSFPNEMIPVIVGCAGALLGIAGMYVMPDFPATNVMDAISVGIVSGLASTGVHQIWKQTNGGLEE